MSNFYKNLVKSLCESENLTDIATLGKASQSSLSKWSKPNDAQRAVMDIDGEINYAFHTDKEQNPWWELTLDKPRFIEYIILHNRKDMCQERARKLKIEVFYGNEYHAIYEGDLLFDAEPNCMPLILPYKYPQTIERIKITSQINEYFHLSRVNVLAIEKKEKPKIKVGIIGTSNSVMKDRYTLGLAQNNPNIVIQKNASVGSSHAALVPYTFSKHDFRDCDVILLDILANEQRALWLHDYDISLSSQIFDYFLTLCAVSHILPAVILMPERFGYNSPQNPKFQRIRKHYIEVCNKRNIPYFDGHAWVENSYTKTNFLKPFQDDVHMLPFYAQEFGNALAKSIVTLHGSHKIINEDLNIYDFKYITVINSDAENKNIIERKTSITENKFLKLSADETHDVHIGECEIVGIAFNMAQSNGILEFEGECISHKMLSNAFFDPNRSLWLVIWSLLKPVKADSSGKVRLKCLERIDIPNIELHDHGKIKEEYSNEPIRIEIEGLIVRSKEMRKAVCMRVGLNLDMEKY